MSPSRLRLTAMPTVALTLAFLAALAPAQNRIELPELRSCAEYEPCLGTVITYPTGLPLAELGPDLARDDTLFLFYDDVANRNAAARALHGFGVDMSHVEFIAAVTDDFYTRDFGAPQTFLPGGEQRYTDPIFWDYSFQGANGGKVWTWGPGAFVNDNVTPRALAAHIGVAHVDFPAFLVGGNIDFDGLGVAFCSQLLLDENRHWGTAYGEFRGLMDQYLGVDELYAMPNYEVLGIQHIDCALKVVDEETLIITRTPVTHKTYGYHEALARAAAQTLTAYGRPYVIHRVDIPVWDGGPVNGELANYANTLIVNSKVFVPLFGVPEDAAALDVYRAAMPGYEVNGYEFVSGSWPMGSWASFDALHCRTHQVFDPEMLLIKHPRVRSAGAGAPIEVRALIRAYSGAALVGAETAVHWRVAGTSAWNVAALLPDAYAHELVTTIPAQAAGSAIEYWISAGDADGRTERRPPLAPAGYYEFPVQ